MMLAKAFLLLFALFLLLLPVVTADHSAERTPISPTAEVTFEPTLEATPEGAAELTPVATAEGTAEITVEPTLAPTVEVTSQPVVLVGDPVHGELVFHEGFAPAPACVNCHNPTNTGKVGFALGPGLRGISATAATRIEGLTAPEYIEQSIRHPGAYLVSGFRDIMYQSFDTDYSDQTIADLVAYLMTL